MRHFYEDRPPGDDGEDGEPDSARERHDADEECDDLDDADDGDDLDDGDDGGDDDLDADFPRGDGTADTAAVAYCPYCGEINELAVDPGGGSPQRYVEDCHVCCQPWRVTVTFDHEGHADARLEALDE